MQGSGGAKAGEWSLEKSAVLRGRLGRSPVSRTLACATVTVLLCAGSAAAVRDPLGALSVYAVDTAINLSWTDCGAPYGWVPCNFWGSSAFVWDSVDFGTGVDYVKYTYAMSGGVAGTLTDGIVDFILDDSLGTVYATMQLLSSDSWCASRTDSVNVLVRPTGIHSVWLCPRNNGGTPITVSHGRGLQAPVFLTQPQNVTVIEGAGATFTAKADGFPRPTYQWVKNGATNVVGANDTILRFTAATLADAGSYTLVATNSAGSATSNAATLTVGAIALTVSQTPNRDTTVTVDGSITYHAVVTAGSQPYTYQWKKNGSNLVRAGTKVDSAYLVLSNLAMADSGQYSVTVTNTVGPATTTARWLHVAALPPRVTVSPANVGTTPVTRAPNDTLTFRAAVSQGTAPFTYQWYKNGTAMSGRTRDTLKLGPLAYPADTGTYRVVVTNTAGSGSDSARLRVDVVAPSQAAIFPRRDTVLDGANVLFYVVVNANATPAPTYVWKDAQGTTVSTDDTLQLNAVPYSQNNLVYAVTATNAAGSISASCTLQVVQAVSADFTASPLAGLDSLTVTFTDNSTGSIAQWRWNFVDTTLTYTTRQATVTHTYHDTGSYTASLIVIGVPPAGRDTAYSPQIAVRTKGSNPMLITQARYVSPTQVELTFSGQTFVKNNPLEPPMADSIGLWFAPAGQGIDTSRGNTLTRYAVADLQASGGDVVTVTVRAPASVDDTVYLFWTCPLWKDAGLDAVNMYNARTVRMTPINDLVVSGQYLGNTGTLDNVVLNTAALDSAQVLIQNVGTLQPGGLTGIDVSWYLARSTAVGETRTLSPTDVVAGSVGGTYTLGISHALFEGDTQAVAVSVTLVCANGLRSSAQNGLFVVGWPKPSNPYTLQVSGKTAESAELTWNAVTGADSVRMVYSQTEIPTGVVDLSTGEFVLVSPGPGKDSTHLTVSGLSDNTTYSFAIQMLRNLQWSDVTIPSRVSVKTDSVNPNLPVVNTAVLQSLTFDGQNNVFVVSYTATPPPMLDLQMGIVWSLDSSETGTRAPSPPTFGMVLQNPGASGDTSISLGNQILFDTTYYFALWLRGKQGTTIGPWSGPTSQSTRSVRTPNPSWQVVTLFARDTVKVFNEKVWLWKDRSFPNIQSEDTVRAYAGTVTLPSGLTQVGPGFSLGSDAFAAFCVGIKFDSIPMGYTYLDLGLYRVNGDSVLYVYGSQADPGAGIVFAQTKDFVDGSGTRVPFVVLADTRAPTVSITSDTASAVGVGQAIDNQVTVSDNIANVAWKVLYAKDDDPFVDDSSLIGYVCGSCGTGGSIGPQIPGGSVTSAVGVRALLIVTDGIHGDTVDISRQVTRTSSDGVTCEELKWTPLWATAELTDRSASSALSGLAPSGGTWTYDNTKFRLYRYLEHTSNASKASNEKWLEYSESTKDYFRFDPGVLMWLKTRDPVAINLGSGVTPSMKRPVTMALGANQWTDVALPYLRFTVCIGDILASTGTAGDTLEIYGWQETTYDGAMRMQTSLVYSPFVPGTADRSVALESYTHTPYSVRNYTSHAVTLSIPPIASTQSAFAKGLAKQGADEGWSFRIVSRTERGTELSPVYCGYRQGSGGATYLPSSPTFLPIGVGVYDRAESEVRGHIVAHRLDNGGFSCELAFYNNGENAERFEYRIVRDGGIPQEIDARVVDPVSGGWQVGEMLSVEVGAGERQTRTLAIGSTDYLSSLQRTLGSMRTELVGCYPNPFTRSVTIRYTAPGYRVSRLTFVIFDTRGKQVWSAASAGGGAGTLMWDGKDQARRSVAPGLYVLRVTAFDERGGAVGRFKNILTYVPK